MNQESNRIDEELVCIDSFVQCLKQNFGLNEILVEREENDPPDFWVTIENVKYVVEVTSIVSNYGYEAYAKDSKKRLRMRQKVEIF